LLDLLLKVSQYSPSLVLPTTTIHTPTMLHIRLNKINIAQIEHNDDDGDEQEEGLDRLDLLRARDAAAPRAGTGRDQLGHRTTYSAAPAA